MHSKKVFKAAVFQTDIEKKCFTSANFGVKNIQINGKTIHIVKKSNKKIHTKQNKMLPFLKKLLKLNKIILLLQTIFLKLHLFVPKPYLHHNQSKQAKKPEHFRL